MERFGRPRPDTRPLVVGLIDEIRGVDDERVSFPAADRVAEPLTDVAVRTTIDGDDPSIAVLLVKDRHVSRALHDLIESTVGTLPHHAGDAVGQAAFPGVRIQIRFIWSDAVTSGRTRVGFL